MIRKSKSQLEALVASLGGSIDWSSRADAVVLDAPLGHEWVAGGHSIVEPFENAGGQSWRPQAYADAYQRAAMGVRACDPGCEECADRAEELTE